MALQKTKAGQITKLLLLKPPLSQQVRGSKAQSAGPPASSAADNAVNSKEERGEDETRPTNPTDPPVESCLRRVCNGTALAEREGLFTRFPPRS